MEDHVQPLSAVATDIIEPLIVAVCMERYAINFLCVSTKSSWRQVLGKNIDLVDAFKETYT